MIDFDEITEFDRKKFEAQDSLDVLRALRIRINFTEQKLSDLKISEDEAKKEFYKKLNIYYQDKFNVKEGDVITYELEGYRFVKFVDSSKDPMVNYKLKNGNWSKKIIKLSLYDWDKRDRMDLGILKL